MSGLEFTENTAMAQAMKQAQTNQTQGAIPTARTTGSNTSNPFGFGGVSLRSGTMAYAPIHNAMGSEAYIKLGKQLKEMAKDHNRQDALEVRVIELDRNVNPNLHFASYVVCVTSLQRPDLGVGCNVIMMEAVVIFRVGLKLKKDFAMTINLPTGKDFLKETEKTTHFVSLLQMN